MLRRPVIGWAILCIAAATPVFAQITAFWQQVTITPAAIANDPTLASMQCWDLMTTTTGNWSTAEMNAQLSTGNFFYKHPLGGFTKPPPAAVANSPALAFTTYVTSPNDDGMNNNTQILSGHPQSRPISLGDQSAVSPGEFSLAWGELFFDPPGTFQIARLTFPQGVLPDILNNHPAPVAAPSRTSQGSPEATTEIPDIPEPGMVVFSVALLATMRRRRSL
jgi:hypothetical protein